MVSIIVPVYKSESTLQRCVESLCRQTEEDLEILLVEDGSPDGSGVLCDALAKEDGRISVIHKENGGVSSARNAGIQAAKGEYVLFVDSDDYTESTMVERLLKAIVHADIAICGYHHHFLGRDVEKIPYAQGETGEACFLKLYERGFMNMPWNKLYRRELLGRFEEGLSLGEDLLFNLDYLRRVQGVSIVSEPLYHYIQDNTGETLSSQKRTDRLELGKRLWRETSDFYEELSGHRDESGVIDARLIQEVLDDVEAMPLDESREKEKKLEAIRSYCVDPELRQAGAGAALSALDYKILHFCMKRNWVSLTYLLSVWRSLIVKLLR